MPLSPVSAAHSSLSNFTHVIKFRNLKTLLLHFTSLRVYWWEDLGNLWVTKCTKSNHLGSSFRGRAILWEARQECGSRENMDTAKPRDINVILQKFYLLLLWGRHLSPTGDTNFWSLTIHNLTYHPIYIIYLCFSRSKKQIDGFFSNLHPGILSLFWPLNCSMIKSRLALTSPGYPFVRHNGPINRKKVVDCPLVITSKVNAFSHKLGISLFTKIQPDFRCGC